MFTIRLVFLLVMVVDDAIFSQDILERAYSGIVRRHVSSPIYGYSNVYVRYIKKDEHKQNILKKNKDAKMAFKKGGPYRYEPWRKVKIPNPMILNERFRNPKFVSRHPKRNFMKSSDNTANILNTNYKQAFLKGKKFKVKKRVAKKSGMLYGKGKKGKMQRIGRKRKKIVRKKKKKVK